MPSTTVNPSSHITSPIINARNDEDFPGNEETSPLTSRIKDVNNSKEKLSIGGRKSFTRNVLSTLNSFWSQRSGQKGLEKEEDCVGLPLTEVIAEGEALRLQIESHISGEDNQNGPKGWKGGLLKRCLIGAGILTGAGVLGGSGYRYYAGRGTSNRTMNNSSWPEPTKQTLGSPSPYSINQSMPDGLFSHPPLDKGTNNHVKRHLPVPVSTNNDRQEYPGCILNRGETSKEDLLIGVADYLLDGEDGIDEERIVLLAREVQSNSDLFGKVEESDISPDREKSIVRKWFLFNVYGMQPEECLLNVINKNTQPQGYTVSSILKALDLSEYLDIRNMSRKKLKCFSKLFQIFLSEEMFFLQSMDNLVIRMNIRDYEFLRFYAGSQLLGRCNFHDYTSTEAIDIGRVIMDVAFREGITKEHNDLLKLPIELTRKYFYLDKKNEREIKNHSILNEFIDNHDVVNGLNRYMNQSYSYYISAVRLLLNNSAMGSRSYESQSRGAKPHITSTPNLSYEYLRLTQNVVEKFIKLDEILILTACCELPESDRNHIFSSQISILNMYVVMRTEESDSARCEEQIFKSISLREDDVDLVSVQNNGEERIYALKRNKNSQAGYKLIRVDRDIIKYINSGIINYQLNNGCSIDHAKVISDDGILNFSIIAREKNIEWSKKKSGSSIFVDNIVYKHKINIRSNFDTLAQRYVKSNNPPSLIEWGIQFYNYIEEDLKKQSGRHVLSCRTPIDLSVTAELAKRMIAVGILDIPSRSAADKLQTVPLTSENAAAKEEARNLLNGDYFVEGRLKKEELLAVIANYLHEDTGRGYEDEGKLALLVKSMIINSDFLAKELNNEISPTRARAIVRQWFFHSILGMQPDECILNIMKKDFSLKGYVISDILELLSLSKYINSDDISESKFNVIQSVWYGFLKESMPFLKFDNYFIKKINLWSLDFSNLYAGTQFLDRYFFQDYTPHEAMEIGEQLWRLSARENGIAGKNYLFDMPALIFIESGLKTIENRGEEYVLLAINEYVKYRLLIKVREKWIEGNYFKYLSFLIELLSDKKNGTNLNVTPEIISAYQEIDKNLLFSAFSCVSQNEYDFIFNDNVNIYRMGMSVNGERYFLQGGAKNKFDLIAVNQGDVERIYMIKSANDSQIKYQLIRVDRDIVKYIESGIFDYDSNGDVYSEDDMITLAADDFSYEIYKESEVFVDSNDETKIDVLIEKLSLVHTRNILSDLKSFVDEGLVQEMTSENNDKVIPFHKEIQESGFNISNHNLPLYLINPAALSSTVGFEELILPENISKSIQLLKSYRTEAAHPTLSLEGNGEKQIAAVAEYLFDGIAGISDNPEKIEKLARDIQSRSELNPNDRDKYFSIANAKKMIRHWFFKNILGMPPEYFIYEQIYKNFPSKGYSVGSIPSILSIDNVLNTETIPESKLVALRAVWNSLLIEEMPFLKFNDISVKKMDFRSNDFSNLYTGTKIMEGNLVQDYIPDEAIIAGALLWDVAITEGIRQNEAPFFKTPIQYYVNSKTYHFNDEDKDFNAFSVNVYIKYREALKEKYEKYLSIVSLWMSKKELAEKIISDCSSTRHVPRFISYGDYTNWKSPENDRFVLMQDYLNGMQKPCPDAPGSLHDEYKRQTESVAAEYKDLDGFLIENALHQLPKDELDFIHSSMDNLYSVKIKTRKDIYDPEQIPDPRHQHRTFFGSINCELFSAVVDGEERIYALSASNPGDDIYTFIRVDRDINNFMKNGMRIDFDAFNVYSYEVDERKILGSRDVFHRVSEFLSEKRRLVLYNSFYSAGNDKSELQKLWNTLKMFIPFYVCIESGTEGQIAESMRACTIDGILSLPVIGQVARMGMKTGQAAVMGLNAAKSGAGVGKVISLSASGLPTKTEMSSLGKNIFRVFDPGFEIAGGSGIALARKIINRVPGDKVIAKLLNRITVETEVKTLPSDQIMMALLPGSEAQVPMICVARKKGLDVYRRVDLETRFVFGREYFINNINQLSPIPIPLSERLRKIQIEGLGGKVSKAATNKLKTTEDFTIQKTNPIGKALTSDEISSIYAYGRAYHSDVNEFMIAGMPENYLLPHLRAPLAATVSDIKSAIKKIPPYQGVVFRGALIKNNEYRRLQKGCLVSNRGFLSTSLDLNVALLFKGDRVPGYTPVIYKMQITRSGYPVSLYTMKAHEKEVLIDSNVYFVVNNIEGGSIYLQEIDAAQLIDYHRDDVVYLDKKYD